MRKHILPITAAAAVVVIAVVITLTATNPAAAAEIAAAPLNFFHAIPATVIGWIYDLAQGVVNAITSVVHVYDAPGNAGVQIAGIGGYEWRGTPGLFLCDGQC